MTERSQEQKDFSAGLAMASAGGAYHDKIRAERDELKKKEVKMRAIFGELIQKIEGMETELWIVKQSLQSLMLRGAPEDLKEEK